MTTKIIISLNDIWAGSGDLIDGRIENCGAQFCDDNDESLGVYDAIEQVMTHGVTAITVPGIGVVSWEITPPTDDGGHWLTK